jgi:hypothetical protein
MSVAKSLAIVVSLISVVVFGSLLAFGGIAPYVTTPLRTVDDVHALSQSTQPVLVWDGLGLLVSLTALGLLIFSRSVRTRQPTLRR